MLWPAVGVLFLGGGALTTGLLSAAFAAGAVLAGLLSGGLVAVVHQGRVIVGSIVVFGLVIGAAASVTAVSWAALGGGLLCVVAVLAVTATQRSFWAYDARHPTP